MKTATVALSRGGWYIVDADTIITLGPMSIPQAALRLHDYRATMRD
jgi:hypothetical protein